MNNHTASAEYIPKPGDHICSLYNSDESYIETLTAYLKEGLINNERVIYLASEEFKPIILDQLSAQTKDLDKRLTNGQLTIQTSQEANLQKGSFCTDNMVNLWKEICTRANQEGFHQIRAGGNASWVLTNPDINIDDYLCYESRLNQEIFWEYNCIGLCHYDTRHFNNQILNAQIAIHPICHIDNEFYPNQFYITPESHLIEDYEALSFHHKINQMKERENSKKYGAMLYKQNEELREFSHLLAHDLKEPIRSAHTLGTMLKEVASPEILERLLLVLTQATDRIDSISQLNRVIRGNNSKDFININHVLENLIENYREILENISGNIELVEGHVKLISANEKQMLQLFSNLIDNSIKYRKATEKLKIIITTQMVGDSDIKISVQDNGIGFPSYIKDKIFSPFFRSHTVLDIEGTGIGLAICQRIIHHCNGRITANGEEGGGATFDVYLPC